MFVVAALSLHSTLFSYCVILVISIFTPSNMLLHRHFESSFCFYVLLIARITPSSSSWAYLSVIVTFKEKKLHASLADMMPDEHDVDDDGTKKDKTLRVCLIMFGWCRKLLLQGQLKLMEEVFSVFKRVRGEKQGFLF
jgi:hypothetical protein